MWVIAGVEYLDGFEDCDDGITLEEKPFLSEVGLEKLHSGAGELLFAQCSCVAFLFGIWHGQVL